MKKIISALKSRTVWMFVLLFVINGIEGVREPITASAPNALPFIDAIITFAGIYFRVRPVQKFKV